MAAPHGRSLADFLPLKPAEELLLKNSVSGAETRIARQLPTQASPENTVRGSFLRFLILGGDDLVKIHERGVLLAGAYIEGKLDLGSVSHIVGVKLQYCLFPETILLTNTQTHSFIDLSDSSLQGLSARHLCVNGTLCLNRCISSEMINLQDSKISGSLLFIGSQLSSSNGDPALTADRAAIEGGVRLQTGFKAVGEVRFCAAKLNQLMCSSSEFTTSSRHALNLTDASISGGLRLSPDFRAVGTVRLTNTRIRGNVDLRGAHIDGKGGSTLCANSMQVTHHLQLTDLKAPLEAAVLTDARVQTLVDAADSWGENLRLSGFIYENLETVGSLKAQDRIRWFDQQHPQDVGRDGKKGAASRFKKQPWQHAQKVFDEMGRTEDARQIGMELERRLYRAGLESETSIVPRFAVIHHLHGALLGFGYEPMRLIWLFLLTWLSFAAFYWYAAVAQAVFAPSDPLVFQHDDYLTCQSEHQAIWAKRFPSKPEPQPEKPEGAGNWYTCEALRSEYTGFSPLGYSLDILMPLVDLQQEKSWGPMTPTPKKNPLQEISNFTWGHATRLVIWIETFVGWFISLVLVSMASGLIRKRNNE